MKIAIELLYTVDIPDKNLAPQFISTVECMYGDPQPNDRGLQMMQLATNVLVEEALREAADSLESPDAPTPNVPPPQLQSFDIYHIEDCQWFEDTE